MIPNQPLTRDTHRPYLRARRCRVPSTQPLRGRSGCSSRPVENELRGAYRRAAKRSSMMAAVSRNSSGMRMAAERCRAGMTASMLL
jgi:hypothetical protein